MLLTANGAGANPTIVLQPPATASNGDFTVPASQGQLWQIVPVHITGSVVYPFNGFLSPVANPPTVNTENAGRTIPINFSLGGNQGLDIIVRGYPTVTQVDCTSEAPIGKSTEAATPGNSGLSYDSTSNTYTFVWKTDKSMAGTCQQFTLLLIDGSDHLAYFQLK